MDIEYLMTAVDNETNDGVMKLSHRKIKQMKNDMLQRLQLPRGKLRDLHKKLKEYRYIDELPDLKYGTYVRWISLSDPSDIYLTAGGIVCAINVHNGINVVCKNRFNRMFQFNLNEVMLFQKITEQEDILLSALDYLET